MFEAISLISLLAIWVFLIVFFRKLNMNFFKFLSGSIGLFIILMVFFGSAFEEVLIISLSVVLDIIANITKFFKVFSEYGMIAIEGKNGGLINMSLTYQCSGVIELLVFSCLAIFFPFMTIYKKIFYLVLGNLYLFLCNILRILFIVGAVKIFGVESYDFVHLVLARIIFFIMTIILYYKVFTKNQLNTQKVGGIT